MSKHGDLCDDLVALLETHRHDRDDHILNLIRERLEAEISYRKPIDPPMSQKDVENWIMLKGQSEERWFDIRVLDPEVDADPTMRALMEALSDMINQGIHNLPFLEAEATGKPDLTVVQPGGRSARGE